MIVWGRGMEESAKKFHFFFLMVNLDCGYVSPFILMMLFHSDFLWLVKLEWLGCSELLSCPHSRVLVFSLQCSLNMLEGDTGYAHNNQCSCYMRVQLVLSSAIPLNWAFLGSIYSFLYNNSSLSMHMRHVYLWNSH